MFPYFGNYMHFLFLLFLYLWSGFSQINEKALSPTCKQKIPGIELHASFMIEWLFFRHSSADTRPSTGHQHDDNHIHTRQYSVDFSSLTRQGSNCSITRTPSTHSMSRLTLMQDARSISRPVPYESLSSRLASAQPMAGK